MEGGWKWREGEDGERVKMEGGWKWREGGDGGRERE